MTKLIPIILIVVAAAIFSDMFSRRDKYLNGYTYKEKIIWLIIPVVIIIFAGMRTNYNDTSTYIESYKFIVNDSLNFDGFSWKFGDNPGYNLVCMLLKHFNFTSQAYIMLFAIVTYSIYIWFIKKYSTDFFMSIIMFICLDFTFPMAGLKQAIAVAFCLIAVDKAIYKKWFWFVFWLFIAETFHAYSFLYLIVPTLFFVPWQNKKSKNMVITFLLAGVLLKPFLGTVINITSMLGEEYTADSFNGEGVNPFRVAVMIVPLVLSYLFRKRMTDDEYEVTRADGLFINMSTLNGEIMFVGLFGTANYFGRLANYFVIFQVLAVPRLINLFDKKYRNLVKFAAILCYIFFLWFDCTHSGFGTFDSQFARQSIFNFVLFNK